MIPDTLTIRKKKMFSFDETKNYDIHTHNSELKP
jgi:hypothetical protein